MASLDAAASDMDALLKEKAKVVGNKHFRTPEKAAVEVTEKPTPSKQPAKKGKNLSFCLDAAAPSAPAAPTATPTAPPQDAPPPWPPWEHWAPGTPTLEAASDPYASAARAAPEISPSSPPVALWAALADAAGAAGTSSAPTLTLPKPSSKDDFERRVGELRPLAGCVEASFAAVYQRERSLGYWAAGETPLPPDMVKKIKAKSPAA